MIKARKQDCELHILLIPPVINPVSADQAANFIPVGILALLSTIKQAGFKASIYKPEIMIMRDEDIGEAAHDILACNPRSIGFSTWCDSFPISLLLAEEIKRINPDIPLVFGGPQASILAVDMINGYHAIDFVLRGEADFTLPRLVSCLVNGKENDIKSIPGLLYRDPSTGDLMAGSPDEIVRDLDKLPVPAYEKIFQKSRVRIDAGRGCPYPCTYCTTNQFFSKKYRVKSPDRIISEMEYCHQALGVTGMGISHDMFTLDESFIKEFSGSLLSRNQSKRTALTWTCSARTDCVSEKMLKGMKESGCTAIFFGIESGSEKVQREIRKNLNIGDAEGIIRYSTGLGILTIVSYMAGFPGETRRDLNDTLRSILNVALSGARPQLTLLSILPGTTIHQRYAEELEYDGIHSGFSVSFLTEKMKKLIKSDPGVFSSFYHLPNSHISRETYLFLADLVNNIEHFLPTLSMIGDHIRKSLSDLDFLKYIEDNIDQYRYGKNTPLPELYFLTDSLKQYLAHLDDRGLPPVIWDVFEVDFTKAFMIAKYERWQISRMAEGKSTPRITRHDPEDVIKPFPYWKLIETHYYLHHFFSDPAGLAGNTKFRKGNYHYIILPVSHRMVRLIKVPAALVQTFRDLKESTVEEFIRKNVVHLGGDQARRVLNKMIRWGLVEIEKT